LTLIKSGLAAGFQRQFSGGGTVVSTTANSALTVGNDRFPDSGAANNNVSNGFYIITAGRVVVVGWRAAA